MKIITGIFGLLILVLVLAFALSNQQSITVGLWPLDNTLQMPAYVVGLVPLLFGLLFGGMLGWLASLPHRLKARRLHKEVGILNDKIAELQKAVLAVEPSSLFKKPSFFKKSFWKRS